MVLGWFADASAVELRDSILAADLLCSGFHQAAATENAAG